MEMEPALTHATDPLVHKSRLECWILLRALLVLPVLVEVLTAASSPTQDASTPALVELSARSGVPIQWQHVTLPTRMRHGVIGGRSASVAAVGAYAPRLASELSLYPKSLFSRIGIRSIVLCADLTFEGVRRAAVPDFGRMVLYLEVERWAHEPHYEQLVLHHEFFHLLDFKDDGHVYRDESWAALNSVGFVYGAGGANMQDNPRSFLRSSRPTGFISMYATSGIEEDKAETFAHLITAPTAVFELAHADAILDAKVRQMQKLVGAFCTHMNGQFWEEVKRVRCPTPVPR